MDGKVMALLEKMTRLLKMMQDRVNSLHAAVEMLKARQAAFEEACVDSFVCIYDDLPRGKGVHHGA